MRRFSLFFMFTLLFFHACCQAKPYRLQLLHFSDWEGGVESIDNSVYFGALMDYLEDTYPNTVKIAAGDNYLSGPLLEAAGDSSMTDILRSVYEKKYNKPFPQLRSRAGGVDLTIANILEIDATALGNHEMDLGPSFFSQFIQTETKNGEYRWLGATFPYLTTNIDFSEDPSLSSLYRRDIVLHTQYIPQKNNEDSSSLNYKIAPATIIEKNGEKIGIIGVTTPYLAQISSLGKVRVKEPGAGKNDMIAVAQIVQPIVDELVEMGVNKIILASHMQQLFLDRELARNLYDVDILISGGNDHRMTDAQDVKRGLYPGDDSQGEYPLIETNLKGQQTIVVSTDGHYKYLGRLVVDFDEDGRILPQSVDQNISGVFSSTAETVNALYSQPFLSVSQKASLIKEMVDAVKAVVSKKDSIVVGKTNVYLEGRREHVRTESTNLGNLICDAFLEYAKEFDPTVEGALTIGGGIRAPIGEVKNTSLNQSSLLVPQENPVSGKKTGEISQLDIESSLRFNNHLTLVTLSPTQLKDILETAVYYAGPGVTYGGFPQISGISFEYDSTAEPGNRIQNVYKNGNKDAPIIKGGQIIDHDASLRIATVDFLSKNGGDGYNFPQFISENPHFAHYIDLTEQGLSEGKFNFTKAGSEQDILAEYFADHFIEEPYSINAQLCEQRIIDLAKRN